MGRIIVAARALSVVAVLAASAVWLAGCNRNPCNCDADNNGGNNTGGEHVHTWGDWEVTSQATCDAAGVETRTCTQDASHKETRMIAMLTGEACQTGEDDTPEDPPVGGGSFKTVTIGGVTWMAENLNVVTEESWCYGEGGQEIFDWDDDDDGKKVYQYRTVSSSDVRDTCNKYGRLYTWAAAKEACQSIGWRLPSVEDLAILAMSVGDGREFKIGNGLEGVGEKLAAKSGWNDRCYDDGCISLNGNDDYGFSALPSSIRVPNDVWINHTGNVVYWNMGGTVLHLWTASAARDYSDRYDENAIIVMRFDNQFSPTIDRRVALPVRCIAN